MHDHIILYALLIASSCKQKYCEPDLIVWFMEQVVYGLMYMLYNLNMLISGKMIYIST